MEQQSQFITNMILQQQIVELTLPTDGMAVNIDEIAIRFGAIATKL